MFLKYKYFVLYSVILKGYKNLYEVNNIVNTNRKIKSIENIKEIENFILNKIKKIDKKVKSIIIRNFILL